MMERKRKWPIFVVLRDYKPSITSASKHRSFQRGKFIFASNFGSRYFNPTDLGIVMEYAAGGELFKRIYNSSRCTEDEARYFFQQLICGLQYIHSMSSMLYSRLNAIVDSTTNAEPMDLANRQYNRELYPLHSTPNTAIADVWSCGVTLYIMLVGSYSFNDPNDHEDVQKTIQRIMGADYKIPHNIKISEDCRELLSRIFVRALEDVQSPYFFSNFTFIKRILLKEIKSHPWFLKKLAWELNEGIQALFYRRDIRTFSHQSDEEIMKVVGEAKKKLPSSSTTIVGYKSKTEEEK
uniref:non-specific serine/threonine protein kinase n=1 Tax=Cucumis melo TaxID=3656 RepID=A0A9I9DZD5_CUCME